VVTGLNFGSPVTACPPNWAVWSAAYTTLAVVQPGIRAPLRCLGVHECVLQTVFPLRKFSTAQIFLLVLMQLHSQCRINH